MKLRLERRWKKATYTIGVLFVDGIRYFETLEDKDRGLFRETPISVIMARKVYGETAIPAGTYSVDMDTVSPKYGAVEWYRRNCNGGRLPRLKDVRGFEGVLIHPGNTALDTLGCVLVGRNTLVGRLTSSRDTFARLYARLLEAHRRGEPITVTLA